VRGLSQRAPGVGLFAAAVVLPLLRQRGNPSWDSIWGEDGFLLFPDARELGPLAPLFESYAGYLILAPRLLAVPMAWLPVEHLAAYCAITAALATAVLAALCYRWTEGWIASTTARLVLAALVVLMPAAGLETTAVLVNVIWPLACVAPWAILAPQHGRGDVAARAAVLFLAAASCPVGLVFVPLAALWGWRRRSRPAILVVVGAYAVGVVLQLVAMAVARGDSAIPPVDPQRPVDEIARLVLVRLFGVSLVGPEAANRLWIDHGTVTGVAAAAIVATLFALLVRRADRRSALLATGFAVGGVAVLLALVWYRGTLPWRFGGTPFNLLLHMRYSVPAVFLLASAFAVLVGNPPRRDPSRIADEPGRVSPVPLGAFVLHTTVVTVLCFAVVGFRGLGPAWSERLASTAARCTSADQEIVVPLIDDSRVFGVVVRCDELPDWPG
jgi:hypothetical protein